jgi:hypothetical protein
MENELTLTPAEIELVKKARGKANEQSEQSLEDARVGDIMRKRAGEITREECAFLRSQINEAVARGL